MNLDTVCMGKLNAETSMADQVNTGDSSKEHVFFDEYIDL